MIITNIIFATLLLSIVTACIAEFVWVVSISNIIPYIRHKHNLKLQKAYANSITENQNNYTENKVKTELPKSNTALKVVK